MLIYKQMFLDNYTKIDQFTVCVGRSRYPSAVARAAAAEILLEQGTGAGASDGLARPGATIPSAEAHHTIVRCAEELPTSVPDLQYQKSE